MNCIIYFIYKNLLIPEIPCVVVWFLVFEKTFGSDFFESWIEILV
jgi:hypothetical protein